MKGTHDDVFAGLVTDGFFRVDSDGSIWKCYKVTRTGRRIEIAPQRTEFRTKQGYARIRATVSGIEYTAMAHRVVWLALRGPIPPGLEVNHKNGRKDDNSIDNLELVTPVQNMQHALHVLKIEPLRGQRNGRAKLSVSAAREIRLLSERGESIRSLARRFSVGRPQIKKVLTGERWAEMPARAVSP